MKTLLRTLSLLAGLTLAGPVAHAHDGEEPAAPADHVAGDAVSIERSIRVPRTVAELRAPLYDVERWPALLSDLRGAVRQADGVWSIDSRRFGHPHDFRVRRTTRAVVLELATAGHGTARLEYRLAPVDADSTRITVRFAMATPPGFTPDQVAALLRDKAATDLADLAARAATAR